MKILILVLACVGVLLAAGTVIADDHRGPSHHDGGHHDYWYRGYRDVYAAPLVRVVPLRVYVAPPPVYVTPPVYISPPPVYVSPYTHPYYGRIGGGLRIVTPGVSVGVHW